LFLPLYLPLASVPSKIDPEILSDVITVCGSICGVIVWASLCLAYIRYHYWITICEDDLREEAPRFVRHHRDYNAHTFLFQFQPLLAYIGLIGSILVVGFASATWWSTPVTAGKVVIPYAAPVVLFIAFIVIKACNGRLFERWWVKLRPDVTELLTELQRLERIRPLPLQRTQPEVFALEQIDAEPKSNVITRESQSGPTEPARTLSAQSFSEINQLGARDGQAINGTHKYA